MELTQGHEIGRSEITRGVAAWLQAEFKHSGQKFPLDDQKNQLEATPLSSGPNFGGQTASYWGRMQQYNETESLHRAQYAAKVANCTKQLWSTLRAFESASDEPVVAWGTHLITEHLENADYHQAKQFLNMADFWETPIGLGLAYLEQDIQRHGFSRTFRLPQLVRAEHIMYDAANVMALEFEHALESTGGLPKPGASSGNVELWLP